MTGITKGCGTTELMYIAGACVNGSLTLKSFTSLSQG